MSRSLRRWSGAVLVLACASASAAAQAILPPSLELRVPKPPTVANTENGAALVYELHVTNFSAQPMTLKRVDVLAGAETTPLFSLSDSALLQNTARPGLTVPVAERMKIGGGTRAVVYVWAPLAGTASPASIYNRVSIEQGSGDSVRTQQLDASQVLTVAAAGPTIGPPLRGGPWLAGNGPSSRSGHRRALIPIGGAPSVAQRFAIDYVRINDTDSTRSGDPLRNENYMAEGVDALAVADGRVVATKDGIPENVPGVNSRAVPITLETVGGNHIIIDIGGGRYAFYAHLKPGSLRVKLGDQVKRGQVIALVGNTGNSTEPHLHFHISDGNSPLGSEGIPYRYDHFELVGHCRTFNLGCMRQAPVTRTGEIPTENAIIRFP